jgi:hypothetical protein
MRCLEVGEASHGNGLQVWQGGTVLIVVSDPILARQVNTRNYARPRFLLPFAGEQPDAATTPMQ